MRPQPPSRADRARWEWSALAQRIYESEWVPDLVEELRQFYAPEVLQRITHPDTSRNPKKTCDTQLNVMYSEPFTLTAEGQPDFAPLALSRFVPMRQKGHGYTIAMNESLLREDWLQSEFDATGRGISYRVVSAAYATAIATQDRPDVPVAVCEQRERWPDPANPDRSEWTWETWDIRDPAAPVFKIEIEDKNSDGTSLRIDVTAKYMPEGWDGAYPYRDADGPILPYTLYHAAPSDRLWNERHRAELVEGTLKVGCLYTFWLHGFRDCANPQRVGIDVIAPQAVGTGGSRSTDRISLDQTSILLFHSKNGSGGSLDTLEPAMDPEKGLASISDYERGLYVQDGLAPEGGDGDMSRVSGYALVVSRESLRQRQRQMIPACLSGDQMALATAARLVNAYEARSLPTNPEAYGISYHAVPKSLEETRADVERVTMLRNMPGMPLISWKDAMMALHPHLTPEQAEMKLGEIRAEQAANRPAPPSQGQPSQMTDPSSGASPSAGRAAAQVEQHEPEDAE